MTPSAVVRTSIRRSDTARAPDNAAATVARSAPHSLATAAAASALPTWCSPCTPSRISVLPAGVCRVKVARACSSRRTSLAR
ncbi:Uncharacterised protein [Mycobacteroides abscessus subsp. abscessus]|nr:Uncharacterised protein [Mycobacteroides abscessus subsp. abscessus]